MDVVEKSITLCIEVVLKGSEGVDFGVIEEEARRHMSDTLTGVEEESEEGIATFEFCEVWRDPSEEA